MHKSKVSNENYFLIQGWMINELKLKGMELQIFAIIYGFSQDGQSKFTGSLQYLADWTLSTKQNCINHLKSLLEKDLIEKEEFEINNNKYCTYRVKLDTIQKFCIGSQKNCIGIQNFCTNNINNNNIDNNINTINSINNELENSSNFNNENEIIKKEKKMTKKQIEAIKRNELILEYTEDKDIRQALTKYLNFRKTRTLTLQQWKDILENLRKISNNKKSIALEIIDRAYQSSWNNFYPISNFSGKPKSSYSSKPTFDNTATHKTGNDKISDAELDKLSFEEKRNYIMEMDFADMTEKQKEFHNKYCLARDENGNLISF